MSISNSAIKASIWKFLERVSFQIVQLVVQIILARLLLPSDYGMLSLMMVFISFANVMVQGGFNSALIQGKEIKSEDYSSMLLFSELIAVVICVILFIAAPAIENFYNMDNFQLPFRVLIFMLIPLAYHSIQMAKLQREMNFKAIFFATLISAVISGVIGIILAYMDYGIWALVMQQLASYISVCIILKRLTGYKFKFRECSFKRSKKLIDYGWKIMVSNLIETALNEMRSLIIGKKFTSADLGLYNRGIQFPQSINSCFNGVIQSVTFPILSRRQEEKAELKRTTRMSLAISMYVVAPCMIGLLIVAEPLVILLLTETWIECVPFLQLGCIICLLQPVNTANIQSIAAMGRSDIFLITSVFKRIQTLLMLLIATFIFKSVIAIAIAAVISSAINNIINIIPNIVLMNYRIAEFISDIAPPILMSIVMAVTVWTAGLLINAILLKIIVEVILGIIVYLGVSLIVKPEGYRYLRNALFRK